MDNLEIKHFKSRLADYNYLTSKIRSLEEEMLVLETRRGVHSITYGKDASKGSPDKNKQDMQKIYDAEKAHRLEKELKILKNELNSIDLFLKNSKFGGSIKKIHCLGTSTYEIEATRLDIRGAYKEKTLQRIVNKEIIKYLKVVLEDNK